MEASNKSEVRDAATIIVMRTGEKDPFEVLLLQRHSKSGFMGGAYVFPGGTLLESDLPVAARDTARSLPQLDTTPGRNWSPQQTQGLMTCAIRELFEEAGILLAVHQETGEVFGSQPDDQQWLGRARQQLATQTTTFGHLMADKSLRPGFELIHYSDHWVTPSWEKRRFDARFFLAMLPHNQCASSDGHETTRSRWLSPAAAITLHQDAEITLPPPTLRTLEELVAYQSADAAIDQLTRRSIAPVQPKIVADNDDLLLLLPWDVDYDACTGEALSGITWTHSPRTKTSSRMRYIDGRWNSVPHDTDRKKA